MSKQDLAAKLQEQAVLCGITVTKRRCLYVLAGHPEIIDELSLMVNASTLIQEAVALRSLSVPGVQDKYWYQGRLYKIDESGMCQGCKEHVISHALDYFTVDGKPVPHVLYTACSTDKGLGCCCDSYAKPGVIEVTLGTLSGVSTLYDLTHKEGLAHLLPDIAITFLCDALFYNEDRHPGNLTLLYGNGGFRVAPIFDMGNALFFTGEPCYAQYEPEPYLLDQVVWAKGMMEGKHLQYRFMDFYNNFDRSAVPYPKAVVDSILEKAMLCAESEFIRKLVDVV